MSFVMDEDFEYFLEKFGSPEHCKPVAVSTLEHYSEKLPNRLLEYWQEYGFCSFMDGLFWIVNPDDYQSAMKSWLKTTTIPQEDDYHVIARSGFGDMFLWGKKTGSKYAIEARDGVIFKTDDDADWIQSGKENEALSAFFGLTRPKSSNLDDVNTDTPLFAQAVKKFGPLKEDEVFAFEPALFAGGEQTIGHIHKVNIHVHLDILLQMVGQPQVMDIHGLAKIAFGH